MAKQMINWACGHQGEVALFGPYDERRRKVEWMQSQACPQCRAPKQEKKPEAELKDGRLEISGGYEIKETLKQLGYRWDGVRKVWWLEVNAADPKSLVPAWAAIREHVSPRLDLARLERAWDGDQLRQLRTQLGLAK